MRLSFKEFFRTIQRALTRGAFHFFYFLLKRVSYATAKMVFALIVPLGMLVTRRHRKIAREALSIAFGSSKSKEEQERIMDICFRNSAQSMLELAYFGLHPSMVKEKVSIEGVENLQKAMQHQKGVIAVTAHFGNFPLMMLRFAREYPTNAIIRPARDPIIEKDFNQFRTDAGLNTIYSLPRQECVNQSLKVLRNNELLFIPLDQNHSTKGGAFVEFFGQKAATPTGPVVFAIRTQAPLLPVFIMRDKEDTHKIVIEPYFFVEQKDTYEVTVLFNVQKITTIIERYVREYPQEWGWMHRRWKDRPAHSV